MHNGRSATGLPLAIPVFIGPSIDPIMNCSSQTSNISSYLPDSFGSGCATFFLQILVVSLSFLDELHQFAAMPYPRPSLLVWSARVLWTGKRSIVPIDRAGSMAYHGRKAPWSRTALA